MATSARPQPASDRRAPRRGTTSVSRPGNPDPSVASETLASKHDDSTRTDSALSLRGRAARS